MNPRDLIEVDDAGNNCVNLWIGGGNLKTGKDHGGAQHLVVCKGNKQIDVQVGMGATSAWTNGLSRDQVRALILALVMALQWEDRDEP